MKRRSFLKLAIAGTLVPVLGKFNQALGQAEKAAKGAATKVKEAFDTVILNGKKGKKYEYIHNINKAKPTQEASKKKYAKHAKQVSEAAKGLGKPETTQPMCQICSMYKEDKKNPGWGKCTRVGAMGKKKGLVNKEGWCQVWAFKKSALKKLA